MKAYFVGLDLGQTQDYTALAVLERTAEPDPNPRRALGTMTRTHAVRHLQRWPLGTPYPRVVEAVAELVERPPLRGCTLVVDATGVGKAVVDMFREAKPACRLISATITHSGTSVPSTEGDVSVAKRELVSVLQATLQSGRLQVANGLPDAAVLVKELLAFRVKVSINGDESFEAWRARDHDDLVLAVALAAWRAEREPLTRAPQAFAGASLPSAGAMPTSEPMPPRMPDQLRPGASPNEPYF